MVYEEEDFQPMQYGFHLSPDISEQRMVGMLREVEEELHRKTRTKPNDTAQALFARIKFLRMFLQILMTFRKTEDQSNSPPDCNRLLTTCSEMLLIVEKTICLGTISEDRE